MVHAASPPSARTHPNPCLRPQVRAALGTLTQQGADRLVLDIRNNGGGLFPAGVEVGRMLLNKGDIVLIADR